MARLPDAFIDDLLARTDLVEIINARVPLKKQGKEYSARCPFHDERSASFTVSPTKQFYHCFGCQAHGTAISFLMNYDRLEFLDAVDELAKRVGMDVPRDAHPQRDGEDGRALYDTLAATTAFFRTQLAADNAEAAKARAYLDMRRLDAATQERFMVGYAPAGYSALKDALGNDEAKLKLLDRAGLVSRSDNGRSYDKFRDRVVFPIHDRRGRTIAFGGRVLDPQGTPKYLNSPETILFHKGRELYGLWQVRQANTHIARLIVVEGYMDVVALFQHGITQAVATLGTATTPDHAELLFRNAADVYFCFDGDAAGRKAAVRAMESVLPRMKDGRQAFFLFLPDGEDPDSIVHAEGAAGFDARLAAATPLSQFLFDSLGTEVNLATLDGKARLAERAKPMLAQIPDGAFGDLMQQRLTELTGVGARNAGGTATQPTIHRVAHGLGNAAPRRSLVRSAIALLLQQPSLALDITPPFRFAALELPGIDLLLQLVKLVHARPDIATGALLEHFADHADVAALNKLATQSQPGEEAAWREEFTGAVAQLDTQVLQQRVDALQGKKARDGLLDDADKDELRALLMARLAR